MKTPTITHYTIVKAGNVGSLEKCVTELISNGWQPIGGVSASPASYLQAMVRYAQDER